MELLEKLKILADGAKYDVSCSSSGSTRQSKGHVGMASFGGICHTWSADGRCVSLLKILYTNVCIYDCAYCVNRSSNDIPRAAFTPDELAQLTMKFYVKNYIEGLFLSSGIIKSPDQTMSLLNRTMRLLRETYQFHGYIHVKLIPGASPDLIRAAGQLADRVSMNIELPSQRSLARLAPQKNYQKILPPMQRVSENIINTAKEKKKKKKVPAFAPAGQSTQLIIGATPERDAQIMRLSQWMYQKMNLKRVYYSAYVPVGRHKNLPALIKPPLLREHRLYQADWLIRLYHFDVEELFDEQHLDLDIQVDPKASWALHHLEHFPLEVNTADYRELLRVPGIGFLSAKRIVQLRKVKSIRYDDLKKLRVVLKRAKYFITVNGQYHGGAPLKREWIRARITLPSGLPSASGQQYTLFDDQPRVEQPRTLALTGEI